jgi:hypothetical protein
MRSAATQRLEDASGGVFVHGWPSRVVITACAGAMEGAPDRAPGLPVPAMAAVRPASGQVDGAGGGERAALYERAPGAAALLAAMDRAVASPDLGRLPEPRARAIVLGTQFAALNEVIRFISETQRVGAHLVNPGLFPFTVMNAAAGLLAIEHRCEGANVTLNNGPGSVLDALSCAADLVSGGRASIAFAGGFETLAAEVNLAVGRPGPPVVLAGVVAVTTLDHARRTGARPCAELLAFSSGALPELPPAAARRRLLAAAVEHARAFPPAAGGAGGAGAGGRDAAAVSLAHRADQTLLALLGAVQRAAAAPAGSRFALLAGAAEEPAGAALVLAAGPPGRAVSGR